MHTRGDRPRKQAISKTSSGPSTLPCDKVLQIQELQDLIRSHLQFGDIKICSLVCRYWNSIFEPYLWTTVELHEHDRGKRNVLKRHGLHVVLLDYVHADKKTLRFIHRNCPRLEGLSVLLDARSTWIDYSFLERFFARMPLLTTLRIRFDGLHFSPAMFWSLSRLPSLDKLSLDVFYTNHDDNPHRLDANPDSINSTLDHYPPDIFLTILDCCRHLRELTVHGLFLEPVHETSLPTPRLRRKQSILRQWVRKTLRPRRENTPLTPDEAMTHSIDHASTWPMRSIRRKTLPLPQPLDSPDDLDVMNDLSTARTAAPTLSRSPHLQTDQYRIRTLELQSLHMDDEVFCTLTCRCPHLEELGLQGVWAGIREESWLALSRNCQRLRRLAIRHSDMVQHICSVPEMMSLFPRLESVRLVELEFDRDPDFSKVWGHWQDLEKGLNGPHPLKHLYLTGSIRWPLKVLLDVTTQSQGIESLSVGFTLSAVRPLNLGSRAPAYNLNSPWLCHETLTHLDLTCVAFAEQGDFSGFFGHVQRLPRLRSLWISISHVREARSIAAANYGQLPQLKGESRDDIGLDNFQSNLSGASGGGSVGPKEGSFVCFPALEMLRIGMAYYLDGKLEMPVELDEIVYMVTVSPALRRLELRHMSESGVIKELARIYPRIEFK